MHVDGVGDKCICESVCVVMCITMNVCIDGEVSALHHTVSLRKRAV